MNRDPLVEAYDTALSDVFEFIDDFNSSDSESTSTDDPHSLVTWDAFAQSEPARTRSTLVPSTPSSVHSTAGRKKRRMRLPGEVPQSTKFQRDKRDQVLALRQQVLELSMRLEQLQRTRRYPTAKKEVEGPPKPRMLVSVWEDLAILQSQERQRSEQTNRELKAILARQRGLELAVCKLLGKKDALEGMELLRRLRPVPEKVTSNPQLKIDLSDAVLAELEMTAAKLYFRTDSLFPPLEGQPMVTFSTQDKRGDPLGTYIETMATTPMACPLHVAAEILWKGTTRESQDPEKVPKFVRAKCYNTLARSCKLDMCNAVRIDGINFVRRYIELNRVVLVSAAAWFLPMEGIHFQDNVWTIVSRSPVDPLNASVIQSFCQFGAQVSVATSTPKEVYAPVQEYVRGTVGTKLRHLQEKQQRFLLEYGLAPVDTGIC
ncbi:hypothetical protein PRIC1_004869 [Phytophthora ramorum]